MGRIRSPHRRARCWPGCCLTPFQGDPRRPGNSTQVHRVHAEVSVKYQAAQTMLKTLPERSRRPSQLHRRAGACLAARAQRRTARPRRSAQGDRGLRAAVDRHLRASDPARAAFEVYAWLGAVRNRSSRPCADPGRLVSAGQPPGARPARSPQPGPHGPCRRLMRCCVSRVSWQDRGPRPRRSPRRGVRRGGRAGRQRMDYERFIPMINAERSPTFYRFDSAEQFRVWRDMDDRDEEPVVIYPLAHGQRGVSVSYRYFLRQ